MKKSYNSRLGNRLHMKSENVVHEINVLVLINASKKDGKGKRLIHPHVYMPLDLT